MRSLKKSMTKYWQMYLLLIPVVIYYVVFKYVPMVGAQIAFRNFSFRKGIWGSAWVGFKHFERFFSSSQSISIIWNTLYLGFLTLVFCFPVPIILALIINEIRSDRFRNVLKTVTYAPHFVSTIVVVGMLMSMCSPSTGIINTLFVRLGLFKEPLYLMGSAKYFRTMYILSGIWKDSGWNAIIFISALAAVDTSLYEAAEVDGASRWQQLLHITLPGIMPTIVTMLVLRCGTLMAVGYDKILLLYNSTIYETADVISTYINRVAFNGQQFGYSAAVGLFNSVIGTTLLLVSNFISSKLSDTKVI